LQFLRLLFGEPNVLILDEPTNDLDTDILTAMEHLLDSWPGTLIVVSHDRYLLERVTDHQYALLGDGSLRHLTGGIEQYLKLRAASLGTKVEVKASAPVSTGLSGAALRDAEKNLARIERALEKLARDESAVHAQMAEHDQGDFDGLAKLMALQNDLNQKLDDLEAEWLETSEALG
jgi:ABC-type multidrug transport system ATPase subunit